VISGVEQYLRSKNFFFLTVVHRHDPDLLDRYAQILLERGVEGFIAIDMQLREAPSIPTVAVAGHKAFPGVTNIILDHRSAVRAALGHLVDLGHTKIAFMKGARFSSDSEDRWNAIVEVARELKIDLNPDLTVQIDINDPTPQLGYPFAKQLLERNVPFTALFAYNDLSALGAIRAFQEAGLRVPNDISVVGFDDIQGAAYNTPSLTTVRQPLIRMGMIAAQTLLERIENKKEEPREIAIEPEFVIRESTAKPS
jgi:LacI family transcriptional regulator